jgi:fibronectin type 3 domain-containing protein
MNILNVVNEIENLVKTKYNQLSSTSPSNEEKSVAKKIFKTIENVIISCKLDFEIESTLDFDEIADNSDNEYNEYSGISYKLEKNFKFQQ